MLFIAPVNFQDVEEKRVYLNLPTQALCDAVEKGVDIKDACPWLAKTHPQYGLEHLSIPTGWHQPKRLEVGRMRWPTGASRWAYGHFLASSDVLKLAYPIAYGDGTSGPQQLVLTMDSPGLSFHAGNDATGFIVTYLSQSVLYQTKVELTTMYMLPPLPINRIEYDEFGHKKTANGLYLVTLVDERYYWWSKYLAVSDIYSIGTWSDLISLVGAAIGRTVNFLYYDRINDVELTAAHTDYLKPDRGLLLTNAPIPPLLDAIAYNLGCRVVCDRQDNIYLMNGHHASALRQATFQSALYGYRLPQTSGGERHINEGFI